MSARGVAGLTLALSLGCGGGQAVTPSPTPGVIALRPTDAGTRTSAAALAPLLEACWGWPARVEAPEAWPAAEVTPSRDARALLGQLADRRPPDAVAFVAVGREPLREAGDPASRAVHGLGDGRDRVAVASVAFLGADDGGGPWPGRRARVLLHETGHALGLAHCDDPWCLMHDSTDLDDLDRTGLAPCAICWRRYCGVRGQDPAQRRAALAAAAAPLGLVVESRAQADGSR